MAYNKAVDRESVYENKRMLIEKNLEKERKKLEWKKAKILTKEKLNEERIKFIKEEETTIQKSLAELAIQQQLERERLRRAMRRVRSGATDFHDMKVKEYVRQSVPDIDLSHIF